MATEEKVVIPEGDPQKEPEAVTSYAELGKGSPLPVDQGTLMPNIKKRTVKAGHKNYDADRDTMIVGFVLGQKSVPVNLKDVCKKVDQVSPYHFLTRKDGKRLGTTQEPWGVSITDIATGPEEYHCLPPLEIWRAGAWFAEAIEHPEFMYEKLSVSLRDKVEAIWLAQDDSALVNEYFQYWVCSGQGTPGNNFFRIYIVPMAIAGYGLPPHPLMWKKDQLDKHKTGSLVGSEGTWWAKETATTPKATEAKLPSGTRIRCQGCGHWYKVDELMGHSKLCASTNGGDADYAVMCSPECGCNTLDEASAPKEGYPKSSVTSDAASTEKEVASE